MASTVMTLSFAGLNTNPSPDALHQGELDVRSVAIFNAFPVSLVA